MSDREIYPHAPLALVVLEVRHPATVRLSATHVESLQRAFGERLPIMRPEQSTNFDIMASVQETTTYPRFLSSDLHTSVTVHSDSIAVETTAYEGWESFLQIVELALTARNEITPVVGIERVGLRYIDEIRPLLGEQIEDWAPWVNESLLGPRFLGDTLSASVVESRGIIALSPEADFTVAMRYGVGEGQAVVSTPNLRRREELNGTYFLIDIDASWQPQESDVAAYDTTELRSVLSRLHEPVRTLFEAVITPKLREDVLR